MAWIRTSTSLIAFGFTIFKFFEYLATNERRREPIVSPWVIGMIMILLGLTGLTLAWVQHRQDMKALRAEAGPQRIRRGYSRRCQLAGREVPGYENRNHRILHGRPDRFALGDR